jgi:hypothetical protein
MPAIRFQDITFLVSPTSPFFELVRTLFADLPLSARGPPLVFLKRGSLP